MYIFDSQFRTGVGLCSFKKMVLRISHRRGEPNYQNVVLQNTYLETNPVPDFVSFAIPGYPDQWTCSQCLLQRERYLLPRFAHSAIMDA